MDLTRRHLLGAVAGASIVTLLAACSDDDDTASSTEPSTGSPTVPASEAPTTDAPTTDPLATVPDTAPVETDAPSTTLPDAFPVSVEHKFGSTTIDAAPTRVVTVGYTDHDVVLALGVVPVGLVSWYGDFPNGVWPWAEDLLGGAQPTKLDGLNFEAIAALQPDLIIGSYVGLEQSDYDTLTQIAPTVTSSADHVDYGTPWQLATVMIGTALGKRSEAEALVADVEQSFADAAAAHPEFAGKELVYAGAYGEAQVYVESSGSARLGMLTALGFVVPAEIDELAGDAFSADISNERLDVLDHDVLVWELGAAEGMRTLIEGNPVYAGLAVAREGRVVFADDALLAGALAHADVLSLPYALEQIMPMLAEAVAR